jgi:hypothetical protein
MAAFTVNRYMNNDNDILRIKVRSDIDDFFIRLKGNNSSVMNVSFPEDDDHFCCEILPYDIRVRITRFNHVACVLQIRERDNDTGFDTDISERLLKEYPVRVAKTRGRNMAGLKEVGEGLGLPPGIEADIGKYLSGEEHASAEGQTNELKKRAGISLARRPGGGGKRTRRRRRRI